MSLALQQAKLAAAVGEVPIGAVLRLPSGQCFIGHNQTLNQQDATAHAESVVIRQAAAYAMNHRLSGAELYVTLEPCTMCAGLIAHARIGRLVYGAADLRAGAVQSTYCYFEQPAAMHKIALTTGVYADECQAILQNFFARRRRT